MGLFRPLFVNFKFHIRLKIDEGGRAITYYFRPQGCASNDEMVLELYHYRSVSKNTVSGGLVIMAKFLSPPKLMRYRNCIIMAKSLLS